MLASHSKNLEGSFQRVPLGSCLPKVSEFTDFRSFLKAWLEFKKTQNPRWGYSIWARQLGLQSVSAITRVIHGQRIPRPPLVERLVTQLKLDGPDAQYFRDLVEVARLHSRPDLAVLLLERMQKQNGRKARLLDDKTFSLLSKWHLFALREAVRMRGFLPDPDALARRFRFKVTPRELSQGLKTLEQLGLIRKDSDGLWQVAEASIDSSNDIASEALKRYHESALALAHRAVREQSVEERELTSVCLVFDRSRMTEARKLIREFKARFERLMEVENGDSVHHLQIQFFPVVSNPKSGDLK